MPDVTATSVDDYVIHINTGGATPSLKALRVQSGGGVRLLEVQDTGVVKFGNRVISDDPIEVRNTDPSGTYVARFRRGGTEYVAVREDGLTDVRDGELVLHEGLETFPPAGTLSDGDTWFFYRPTTGRWYLCMMLAGSWREIQEVP